MKNRKERRQNPDQWWRIVAIARDTQEIEVVDGAPVRMLGDVQDVVVVQMPESVSTMSPGDQRNYFNGVQQALEAAGIEGALIVPKGVEFVSLRAASPEQARNLDLRHRIVTRKEPPPGTH